MFSIDDGSQISAYVQQTILSWIKLYPTFDKTNNLVQLSDGKFFLTLLESLPNFKLLSPITEQPEQLNLAAKVTVIKNITKSLIKYHQTQLLRDVSEFDINYVQLCMGNKKQIFRLITILFSAIYSQQISKANIEKMIAKLSQEEAQVLRIMIQNSLNVGQECGSCSSRSWRVSEQKKVFAKMELLQNKIQELEIINKSLQENLKNHIQNQENASHQNKKLKEQIKKLMILNDQLSDLHDKLVNQLKISSIQQTATKKKSQITKKKLQDKISKLQFEIQKLNAQAHQSHNLKSKIQHITQINKQIKQQNQNLRDNLTKLQNQKIQLKKTQKMQNQEFIALKQHCSELQIKIQQLSLSLLSLSKTSDANVHKTSYFGHKEIDDSSDSNRYRVKQNLSWLNNQLNYNIEEEENQNNFAIKKQKQPEHDNFDIRTITQRSLQDSSCFENMKQNQSIFINNSQILNIKETVQPKSIKSHQQNLSQKSQKSIKPSSFSELENRYKQQIHLLTCIIIDLQTQLQQARKTNPIIIMDNNSMTVSRMNKFAQKVKQMFKKGGSQIIQKQKQKTIQIQMKHKSVNSKNNNSALNKN